MKKVIKFFAVLFIAFNFLGCPEKNNNEELEALQLEIKQKDETISELQAQIKKYKDRISDLENSISEIERGNPIKNIPILLGTGISNTYSPHINGNVKIKNLDLSNFTEEEKNFYFEYAGSYLRSKNEKTIRNRYSCELNYIENGISFFKLGNSGINIFYNSDDNSFYESDSITASKINYKTYKLPEEYKKISYDTKASLTSEINYEENKEILKLLTNFFTYLSDGNFNDIVSNCYDVSSFKCIRYDLVVEDQTTEKLMKDLSYIRMCFNENHNPMKFYSNLFFSEDKKLYDSIFSDYTLIEFEYPDIFNYFSFVVKKINGEYKIISYRNCLNMM